MSWQYSFNDFAELFFFKRKMIAQHTSLTEKKICIYFGGSGINAASELYIQGEKFKYGTPNIGLLVVLEQDLP